MAGAASLTDDKADPASGVGLSPASVIAAANAADDKTKTTTPTSDPGNLATQTDTPTTLIKDAPSVSIDRPGTLKSAPSVFINRLDPTVQDLEVAEVIRTNAGTDVSAPVAAAVTTEVKIYPSRWWGK